MTTKPAAGTPPAALRAQAFGPLDKPVYWTVQYANPRTGETSLRMTAQRHLTPDAALAEVFPDQPMADDFLFWNMGAARAAARALRYKLG